jgi:acyl-CoA hydrolase
MSAYQFSGLPSVTAALDAVHFVNPISANDVAIFTAVVNRSWRSSFEVSCGSSHSNNEGDHGV